MIPESQLFVSQVPASLVALGEKHNALVWLLRTMKGAGACEVTFSENQIIISVPTAGIPDPLTVDTIYNTTFNGDAIYGSTLNVATVSTTDLVTDALTIYNSGSTFQILSSSVTRNMSIKEIDVCSGGVAKKMLIVASDPY